MKKIKMQPTKKEEQETFICLDEEEKKLIVTTCSTRVFNCLYKKIGTPSELFPCTNEFSEKGDYYISGASWNFNYFNDREQIKKVLSITNLIPRKKDK